MDRLGAPSTARWWRLPLPDRPLGIQRWPLRVVWICIARARSRITVVVGDRLRRPWRAVGGSAALELLVAVTFPVQYARDLPARAAPLATATAPVDVVGRPAAGASSGRDVWPGLGTAVLALVVTADRREHRPARWLDIPVEPTDQFGTLDDTPGDPRDRSPSPPCSARRCSRSSCSAASVLARACCAWGTTAVAVAGSSLPVRAHPPERSSWPRTENVLRRRVDDHHRRRPGVDAPLRLDRLGPGDGRPQRPSTCWSWRPVTAPS